LTENPKGGPVGISQTDLTFEYRASDILAGTESDYRVFRISGGTATNLGGTIDTVTKRATVLGVTQFSDWTLAQGVVTAAPAVIGGRVFDGNGRPVANASVLMTKSNGETVTVRTNNFGNYRFTGITAGETYVVMAQTRQHIYMPKVVSLSDDLTDLDFRP